MFKCLYCDKNLSSQVNLNRHVTKNVCRKSDHTCPKCNKVFKRKENCVYHMKHNVCGDKPQKPKLVLKKESQMNYAQLIEQLEKTKNELNQMKGKYEALSTHPQTINNNNVIVFPKEFGKEDMKYIQEKLGDILGPLIKSHTFNSIPCLFNKMHNNPKIPEYHNVYASSERSGYAMISDGVTFKHQPKKTIIDKIIEDKRSILNDYVDANGDQLGEKILRKYDRYQDQIDSDSEFRKNLESEIGGMLLDMKSVIANDEKTRLLLDKVNDGHFELD